MRLDRFVAEHARCTRKEARALVRGGRVSVDGAVCRAAGALVDPACQSLTIGGEDAAWQEHTTLLLHKPAGVLCATEDPSRRTVLDLVPAELRVRETPRRRLSPVGRLDLDTTGLLVLTTDGALNHRLAHPARHAPKTYVARVSGRALLEADRDELAARFAGGLELRDGTVCQPAALTWDDETTARVVLREGRYHQVKRMVAACGGVVETLHRVAIGGLDLPADLSAPGRCREATSGEVLALTSEP